MQFVVNLSIAVDEAESPEEALETAKAGKGKTINFSVQPRPQQPQGQSNLPRRSDPVVPSVGKVVISQPPV